jgi:HisJ family histidinol phosphate phosphatase
MPFHDTPVSEDPRIAALPDIHGHAKGEHKPFAEERPIPYTARMLFLWFFHACRRGSPRFLMVADHMNYLTFEDPAAVNLVRRALKLAQAGDLYGAAETAGVELGHAAVVSEGLRKGMRYSIGAEIDNDPRCRPDAQNIVDAMKPDGTVRSVHFLPITHPQHGENWMWPFDNPEFKELYDVVGTEATWEIYMATLLDAIEKLPGNIVGHFYVPAKFGHWPDDAVLETYEDRLVDACRERGMAIEVNSRYLYKYFLDDEANAEKFRAVHLRLLHKAKEKGVAIAVGSDAHSPKDQGGAFEAILALLDEADVNEIAFPIGGRLARVALRATEEILRQHIAALAPPPPLPLHVRVDEHDGDDDEDAAESAPEAEVQAPVVAAPRRKRPAAKVAAESSEVAVAVAAEPGEAVSDAVAAPAVISIAKKPRAKKLPEPAAAPSAEPATAPVEAIVAAEQSGGTPVATKPPRPKAVKAAPAVTAAVAAVKAVPVTAVKIAPPKKAAAAAPVAVKPIAAKTVATKPVAAKPVAKKPAAKAAVAKKAVPKKAALSKKKAVAKKPVIKKAATKRPVPKKVAPVKAAPKAVPKKAAQSKTAAKAASKKSKPVKKVAPKKAASKKPAPKKTAAKRPAPVRRPAPKKAKKTAKRARR